MRLPRLSDHGPLDRQEVRAGEAAGQGGLRHRVEGQERQVRAHGRAGEESAGLWVPTYIGSTVERGITEAACGSKIIPEYSVCT